jgi:hypothetical protein
MSRLSPLRITVVSIIIAAGVGVFGWFFLDSLLQGYSGMQHLTESVLNEQKIFHACKRYASEHSGSFPPSLEALFPDYLSDRSVLVSPLNPEVPLGYIYTPPTAKDKDSPDFVVIEDEYAPSVMQRRFCCCADGHTRNFPAP